MAKKKLEDMSPMDIVYTVLGTHLEEGGKRSKKMSDELKNKKPKQEEEPIEEEIPVDEAEHEHAIPAEPAVPAIPPENNHGQNQEKNPKRNEKRERHKI